MTVLIISLAYGFSLLVNVWAFFRISGGLFNPAVSHCSYEVPKTSHGLETNSAEVTIGLCLSGQLPWLRAMFLIPAQLVASMCAGGLVSCMFPGDITQANTILSTKTTIVQGLFIEMFFTAELVFVVLMLAMEKSKDTFLAPIGIGLALFVTMLSGMLAVFHCESGWILLTFGQGHSTLGLR